MSRFAKGTQKRPSQSQASMTALLIRRCRAGPCHMDFLQRWSDMSRCKLKTIAAHLPPVSSAKPTAGFQQYHAFSSKLNVKVAKGTQKRPSQSQASMTALLIRRCRAGPCHMDFLQRWSDMSRCKLKTIAAHLPPVSRADMVRVQRMLECRRKNA